MITSARCRPIERHKLKKRPQVFLEISIDSRKIGRLVIELFHEIVPKTVENFRGLCTGEYGEGTWGHKLCYKNCRFHLIRPGLFIQGGDVVHSNGSSGDSVYGPFFDDENFDVKHKGTGLLSMATGGPNSNTSQFYINLNQNEWLDDKSVVFGRVIGGKHLLGLMAAQGRRVGPPKKNVWISDCDQVTDFDWLSESPYVRSICPVLDNIPTIDQTIFSPLNLPQSQYKAWEVPIESIDQKHTHIREAEKKIGKE